MESAKVKNIILLVLLITNALLLGLMFSQQVAGKQYQQQALLDAVSLLEERGIAARAEDMPSQDFPAPMTLERDGAWELETFTQLLGEDTTLSQRGLVSYYTGALGQAEVRGDGGFSVTFAPGAYPLEEGVSMEDHAAALTQRMGFPTLVTARDEDRVTVTQCCGPTSRRLLPVFSCAAELTYADGALSTLSGTRLVGTPAAESQQTAPLSTATLLVRFRAGVIESGDACTAILSAEQGYALSTDAAGKLRLTPVLRLETDTNLYVLDALTGELSRA